MIFITYDIKEVLKNILRDVEKLKESQAGRQELLEEFLGLTTEGLTLATEYDALSIKVLTSNIITDLTGNNDGKNHGALRVAGKLGYGLYFNGIDNYVSVPTTTIGTADKLSIECWIYMYVQSVGSYSYHKDIVRSYCYDGNGLWGISTATDYNTSEKLRLMVGWITGTNTWWDTNITAPKNQWTHIVLVLDRTTGKATLYRNGSAVDEATYAVGTKPTTSAFRIGSDCAGACHFIVDEMLIYNRALLGSEVSTHYNSGNGLVLTTPYESDLKAYYRFEETEVIEMGMATPTFIIYIEGSIIKVYNGLTNSIEYSSSDAATAIQYAIDTAYANNGGTVYIKKGTYTISAMLRVPSNIVLRGEGWATILYAANNLNTNMIKNKNVVYDTWIDQNIEIRDMKLDCNGINQTVQDDVCGISMRNANKLRFKNLWIVNPVDFCIGLSLYGESNVNTTYCIVDGCVLERNDVGLRIADIAALDCKDAVITNNQVYNQRGSGITCSNQYRVSIVGNSIHSTETGINLEGEMDCKYISILGNNINSPLGITMDGHAKEVVIVGNTLDIYAGLPDPGESALKLYPSFGSVNKIIFANNSVFMYNNTSNAIKLASNVSDVTIANNRFEYESSAGGQDKAHITLMGNNDRTMITGNTFINGGTSMTILNTQKNLNISDNLISTMRYHGLYTLNPATLYDSIISNNIIRDIGLSGGTACGILLNVGLNCMVSGNRIMDGQVTKTMTYGIRLNSGSNNNFVHGNYITDAITQDVLDEGSGNTLSDNI